MTFGKLHEVEGQLIQPDPCWDKTKARIVYTMLIRLRPLNTYHTPWLMNCCRCIPSLSFLGKTSGHEGEFKLSGNIVITL